MAAAPQESRLQAIHLAAVHLMIVAQKMQDPVHEELANFLFRKRPVTHRVPARDLRGNDDIPKVSILFQAILGVSRLVPFVARSLTQSVSAIAEAQDVSSVAPATILPIQPAHFPRTDEDYRQGTGGLAQLLQSLRAEARNSRRKQLKPPLLV